jgi:hypothetical protein
MMNIKQSNGVKMYKSLTVYLYQNSYYEDLVLELFEIENKKKEIFKKISTVQEFKYLDKTQRNNLLELINKEMMILSDLMKANTNTAEEFGFAPDYIINDEESEKRNL